MQKTIIMIGVIFICIGMIWPFLVNNLNLSWLPGDIIIKKERFILYFPIATCLLLSLIISVIVWFFNK
jgi:hypothetical protein